MGRGRYTWNQVNLQEESVMTIESHRGFGVVLDPVQFAAELASLKQRPHYEGRALSVSLPDAVARLFEQIHRASPDYSACA